MRAGTVIALLLCAAGGQLARADSTDTPTPRPEEVTIEHHADTPAPIWGPRHAPVTADVFMQLNNPYPARAVKEAMVDLQAKHPRRLRLVFHVIDSSGYVPEAALEAQRQGRFFEFLDQVLHHRGPVRMEQMSELAEAAGMDVARLVEALRRHTHAAELADNRRRMLRAAVRDERNAVLFNGVETRSSVSGRAGQNALDDEYRRAWEHAQDLMAGGARVDQVYGRALREQELSRPPEPLPYGDIDGVRRRPRLRFRPSRVASEAATAIRRHGRGAEQPRVVIHFFCSFQSRNCGRTWDAIEDAMRVYDGQIYLYFDHLWADDADQPRADLVHEASLCADAQGAFWDFYDLQMSTVYGRPPRQIADGDLRAIAQRLGLDEERFVGCVHDDTYKGEAEALRRKARAAGVVHTPSVIIDGRLYEGQLTRKQLRQLIVDELRPGLLEQLVPLAERVD